MPRKTNPITFSRLYRDFARFQLGLPSELPPTIPVGEFTVFITPVLDFFY